VKGFLLLIFLLSCQEARKANQTDSNIRAASKFREIDGKLRSLTDKLNAKLFTSGGGYVVNGVPVPLDSIEERRIIWVEGEIGKAILITPHFDSADFSSIAWDFVNLAWLQPAKTGSHEPPFWTKYLLSKVEFEVVEKNIDQLLNTSTENLEKITLKDLR